MPISIPKFFQRAFAQNGGKQDVPITGDNSGGRASYDVGFPPVTRIPIVAGGIPPFGTDFNGVLYDLSQAIQYLQSGVTFPFDQDFADAIGGYSVKAIVADPSDPTILWQNNNADNTLPPSVPNGWTQVFNAAELVRDPTESQRGAPFLASDDEVSAGVDNKKMVSPASLYSVLKKASGISGHAKNLRCSSTGTNALVSITADQLFVENADGLSLKILNVNLVIDTATSGANGLDTGALAANTWYSIWVISDGVNARGLASLSATAPTMPPGYTSKARVGWIRTDASANKYPLAFIQKGSSVRYVIAGNLSIAPIMAFGVLGTIGSNLIPVSTIGFFPNTAKSVLIQCTAPVNSGSQISPNSFANQNGGGGLSFVSSSAGSTNIQASIVLQTADVYVASNNAACYFYAQGWEDNL